MTKFLAPGIAAALFAASAAQAVTPVTVSAAGYGQDFNTLATVGTSAAMPAGWDFLEVGGNTTYAAGDGSSNAGGAYSFGTGTATDRAFGSVGSGTVAPIYYGGFFANGLGGAATSIAISYAGEQWRQTNATDDGLTFEYSLTATDLSGTGWVRASALDFAPLQVSPAATTTGTALNGNLAANRSVISGTIAGLDLAAGARFAIRWTDQNSNGSGDQGLGIDDLTLRLTPAAVGTVPEPATWGMMIAGFALVGSAARRRRRTARVAA